MMRDVERRLLALEAKGSPVSASHDFSALQDDELETLLGFYERVISDEASLSAGEIEEFQRLHSLVT